MSYRFYSPLIIDEDQIVHLVGDERIPSFVRVKDRVVDAKGDDFVGMPLNVIFLKHGPQRITASNSHSPNEYVFERVNALGIFSQMVLNRTKRLEPINAAQAQVRVVEQAVGMLVRGRGFLQEKPCLYGAGRKPDEIGEIYAETVKPIRDRLLHPALERLLSVDTLDPGSRKLVSNLAAIADNRFQVPVAKRGMPVIVRPEPRSAEIFQLTPKS